MHTVVLYGLQQSFALHPGPHLVRVEEHTNTPRIGHQKDKTRKPQRQKHALREKLESIGDGEP